MLSRLEELRLIDDAAFIELYVRDRIRNRPMGVRRMASELWAKGVPRDISIPAIERVLREEGTDERALARRVAENRYAALRDGDDRTARRRLLAHLGRRGFPSATAHQAVREVSGGDPRRS